MVGFFYDSRSSYFLVCKKALGLLTVSFSGSILSSRKGPVFSPSAAIACFDFRNANRSLITYPTVGSSKRGRSITAVVQFLSASEHSRRSPSFSSW